MLKNGETNVRNLLLVISIPTLGILAGIFLGGFALFLITVTLALIWTQLATRGSGSGPGTIASGVDVCMVFGLAAIIVDFLAPAWLVWLIIWLTKIIVWGA